MMQLNRKEIFHFMLHGSIFCSRFNFGIVVRKKFPDSDIYCYAIVILVQQQKIVLIFTCTF